MDNKGIIRLDNVDGHFLCLYHYDTRKISEGDAVAAVLRAFEDAYQMDQDGELEDGDIHTEVDDRLERQGIVRVAPTIVTTIRL